MFRRRTLFVVGAGASSEVNMPVGSELAKAIGIKCDIRFEHGYPAGNGDHELFGQLERANSQNASKLQPTAWLIRDGIQLASSIDDFLDLHRNNTDLNLFGKTAIVKSILEAERQSSLYFSLANDQPSIDFGAISDTWLVKFVKALSRGRPLESVDQLFDNVAFIVFNYDRCFEYFLLHALQRLYGVDQQSAQKICGNLTIIHPYGSVGPLPSSESVGVSFGASSSNCCALASGIRTYTEQVIDNSDLAKIHKLMLWAERIIFLGFAYHDQNLLILDPGERLTCESVYGTALGMSNDDAAVVKRQIEKMMRAPLILGTERAHIENDLTSGGLFDYFAKSLSSDGE
jgi:hypothetical protein